MKKTRWFIALLLAAAFVFGGCSSDSDDDDDSSSSSSITASSVKTNSEAISYILSLSPLNSLSEKSRYVCDQSENSETEIKTIIFLSSSTYVKIDFYNGAEGIAFYAGYGTYSADPTTASVNSTITLTKTHETNDDKTGFETCETDTDDYTVLSSTQLKKSDLTYKKQE